MTEKKTTFEKLNEEQRAVSIPYYLHEGEMTRLERLNKKWFIAFLVVLVMLFVTNGAWVVYEMQYETYYYSQEARSDNATATALLNTGEGDVTYYGNEGKTNVACSGQENQQQQPNEAMPDM